MAAACANSQALVAQGTSGMSCVCRASGTLELIGIAAILALPSVIRMMMFGQTRIFFTMSRDTCCRMHCRTCTLASSPCTRSRSSLASSSRSAPLLPVGKLADTSNSGTLLAFAMVAIGADSAQDATESSSAVPHPIAWIVCPLAVAGCLLLFVNLSPCEDILRRLGLVRTHRVPACGYRRSHLANGTTSPN
jgi:APA family basic amino acid/polyamine antiporter